jgi:hypothetical protein
VGQLHQLGQAPLKLRLLHLLALSHRLDLSLQLGQARKSLHPLDLWRRLDLLGLLRLRFLVGLSRLSHRRDLSHRLDLLSLLGRQRQSRQLGQSRLVGL